MNQYARKYFEGGGHINAAGGKSTLSLPETEEKFIKTVKELF
jgi:phosphoesterase RecJ-like protein